MTWPAGGRSATKKNRVKCRILRVIDGEGWFIGEQANVSVVTGFLYN